MTELAVTVIGPDRPGIVADVAEALAALGANLTDSTMTRLRGHFTMTLICAGELRVEQVEAALAPLGLPFAVRDVGADEPVRQAGETYLVSVHGADRLGIVAAVTRELAGAGANITDLSTRLTGPLYVLLAEVELPAADAATLAERLAVVAAELDVGITFRPTQADLL
ncbi:glycine cleavage system protein R [Hamadaea tsunoensis]|uniref:glycine cleavage system protein R n=1 Tax=Hamadaea tsunoensis TaxID=53368 RepID=UPI00040A1033|nr:ACT domain-containing protein [Hamadaea tsunoensis]